MRIRMKLVLVILLFFFVGTSSEMAIKYSFFQKNNNSESNVCILEDDVIGESRIGRINC